MRLLAVNLARSIWLFNTGDLNPHGLDMRPILEGVRAKYAFEKFQSLEELRRQNASPEFGHGSFQLKGSPQIQIQKLALYSDGLIVETKHSTEAGDSFLADMVMFAASDFGLSIDPIESANRLYVSELEVTTTAALDAFNEKIAKFSGLVSAAHGHSYHGSGFKISTDPGLGPGVMFAFERKAGAPFQQNRYWSQAPLGTKLHLDLLVKLEEILAE